MSKQVYILEKCYNSLIDEIKLESDNCVIRTQDGRFFSVSLALGEAIQKIENHRSNTLAQDTLTTILTTLLHKQLYLPLDSNTDIYRKEPKLTLHLNLISAELATNISKVCRLLLQPIVMCIAALLSIGIIGTYCVNSVEFSYSNLFTFSMNELFWVVFLLLASSLWHEIGHASACAYFSGRTGSIGVGVNVCIPCFFANVSNIYMISKEQRMVVALAGVYFQILFNAVLIMSVENTNILEKYILFSLLGMFFNVMPIYRNDGFWFLNDLLGKKDLLKESYGAFISKKMQNIHVIYLIFMTVFLLAFIALNLKFMLISGPELISFITFSKASFTEYIQLLMIISHYFVGIFALFLLIKFSLFKAKELFYV